MTVGRSIYIARLAACRSLEAVAARAQIKANVLADMEQDKARISDGAVIFDIAEAIGTSPAAMLGDESLACFDRQQAREVLRPYLWRLAKERGERLRVRREYLGFTKQDVAKRLKRSNAFVSDLERGVTLCVPAPVLEALSGLYSCSVSWLLGNETASFYGPAVTDRKLLRAYHPFTVCPTHINELCHASGMSEFCLARETGFPEFVLQRHHEFPRIEISEAVFQALCEAFSCAPTELRRFPFDSGSVANTAEQDVDRILCDQILKILKAQGVSANAFQTAWGLVPEDWARVKDGTMRFSKDAVKVLQSRIKISFA